MLDEALEALPYGAEPVEWFSYARSTTPVVPVLCTHRIKPETGGGVLCPTWTLGVNDDRGALEWWDDRWVRLSFTGTPGLGQWKIVWEGSRVAG